MRRAPYGSGVGRRLRADLLAVAAQDVEDRLREWPLSPTPIANVVAFLGNRGPRRYSGAAVGRNPGY